MHDSDTHGVKVYGLLEATELRVAVFYMFHNHKHTIRECATTSVSSVGGSGTNDGIGGNWLRQRLMAAEHPSVGFSTGITDY